MRNERHARKATPGHAKPSPSDRSAGPRRLAGRHDEAAAAYERILPLINFENRQCGLLATKVVMHAGGVIASDCVRHPLKPMHDQTRHRLLAMAERHDLPALRWGK